MEGRTPMTPRELIARLESLLVAERYKDAVRLVRSRTPEVISQLTNQQAERLLVMLRTAEEASIPRHVKPGNIYPCVTPLSDEAIARLLQQPPPIRLANLDLSGARLEGARLEGADLSGARLSRANLRGALLEGADLQGALCAGTDLREADLVGANLRGARLHEAKLAGANLSRADLQGADLSWYADLTNADLSGADLTRSHLAHAMLRGARLRGVRLRGANLSFVRGLFSADLEDTDLAEASRASASHWRRRARPMSAAKELLPYVREFSPVEYSILNLGARPATMEDHWFIYLEDDWLAIHCSYGGACIYSLRLEEGGDHQVREAWVDRAPMGRLLASPAQALSLLTWLIDGLLLDKPGTRYPGRSDQ